MYASVNSINMYNTYSNVINSIGTMFYTVLPVFLLNVVLIKHSNIIL